METASLELLKATKAIACSGAERWKPSCSRLRWLVWTLALSEEAPAPQADWSTQQKCRGEPPRPKDFSLENSFSGQAERLPIRSNRS